MIHFDKYFYGYLCSKSETNYMSNTDKKNLFSEFPEANATDWKNAIIRDLKGADYDKKVIWKTPEGFDVKPFYNNEDLIDNQNISVARGYKTNDNNWEISQEIIIRNINDANKSAVDALCKGADSITFIVPENISELIKNQNDLSALLKGINLEKNTLRFISGDNSGYLFGLLEIEIKIQNVDSNKVRVIFDCSPIGDLTTKGHFCSEENLFEKASTLITSTSKNYLQIKLLGVNGYSFKNAGSLITQELAYSIAIASEYLSLISEKGADIKNIANHLTFNFGVGSNYFMEIAKLRAARILWEKLLEAYLPNNTEVIPMNIHSITSDRNMAAYDYHTNLLRETTESMSAIIGGTQSLTVRPFDSVFGSTNEISQRLSRNIQIVLKEEAHLNKVVDIAGGSYYIENLTKEITEQAWKLFLEIEEKGGYIKAFENGFIQEQTAATQQKSDLALATQNEILLGVNRYPDLNEKAADHFSKNENANKSCDKNKKIAEPIKIYRGSSAFEALRLTTEAMKQTPKVFLLTFGNLVSLKARAFFTTNFFGCAGFKIQDNARFETIEAGIKAAIDSKAEIVVMCSSDEEYIEAVPQIAKELKSKTILVMAGYPKDMIDTYKKEGIEHFIHLKSNLLEELQNFQKILAKNI